MKIKQHLRYLFLFVLGLFVLNKFLVRPWVMNENLGFPYLAIVNSFPNFAEAVVGTLVVINLILYFQYVFSALAVKISDGLVCLFGSLISGFYVVSQEFKLHNIGGNNVYDPNDVVASLIGLVFINIIFLRYGVSSDEID